MRTMILEDLRSRLIRQEETIIFALIERAQFRRNDLVYQPGAIALPGFPGSFCDYMLYETECVHARVRRYTSPDEHPFSENLPEPILPPVRQDSAIKPNTININAKIREIYLCELLPKICFEGDCQNYGSSAVCDVSCLQALSKRIHYGKFIAEAKFQSDPATYTALIAAGDRAGILNELVDKAVENRLLDRVALKAATYGQEPGEISTNLKIKPNAIAEIYADWIIPLTCDIEVAYLLQRLDKDSLSG